MQTSGRSQLALPHLSPTLLKKQMHACAFALVSLLGLGCVASKPIPGVIQAKPGEQLESISGPTISLGPFNNPSDAIQAACPFILNLPHATAGKPTGENFLLRWQLSQEYCAWIYYTPEHKYEMSMLTTGKVQDDPKKRSCGLPATVSDSRYPPASLGYLFAVHNHPYESILSDDDIQFIVDMAVKHGLSFTTDKGQIPISIIAFYTQSDESPLSCDGFFQYIPGTGELLKWTNSQDHWGKRIIGRVIWTSATTYRIDNP